jgi:hypothetical protein
LPIWLLLVGAIHLARASQWRRPTALTRAGASSFPNPSLPLVLLWEDTTTVRGYCLTIRRASPRGGAHRRGKSPQLPDSSAGFLESWQGHWLRITTLQCRAARFLCHVYNRMRDPSSHSYAPTRHILETGVMTQQRKQAMTTKDLALAASITMLVAISGLASASAAGSDPAATSRSNQQVRRAFNAYYPATATETVDNNKYRYHGGPKVND